MTVGIVLFSLRQTNDDAVFRIGYRTSPPSSNKYAFRVEIIGGKTLQNSNTIDLELSNDEFYSFYVERIEQRDIQVIVNGAGFSTYTYSAFIPPLPKPPDPDEDGIPNNEDACPNIPGKRNADPAKNGCPDPAIINSLGSNYGASRNPQNISYAFDMNMSTAWNSGGDPPVDVSISFSRPMTITRVDLYPEVNNSPVNADIEIYGEYFNGTRANLFGGSIAYTHMTLTQCNVSPTNGIVKVIIKTNSISPSRWAAWRDINIWGY